MLVHPVALIFTVGFQAGQLRPAEGVVSQDREAQTAKGGQSVPAVVKAAFVNDGHLCLLDTQDKMVVTEVRGHSPCLASDGGGIVYTKSELADRVYAADQRFPRLGTTTVDEETWSWRFEGNTKSRLGGASRDAASLTMDGAQVAWVEDGSVVVRGVAEGPRTKLGLGTRPVWRGSAAVVFEREARLLRAPPREGDPAQAVLPMEGQPVPLDEGALADHLRQQLRNALSGSPVTPLYAQGHATAAACGVVGFLQVVLGMEGSRPVQRQEVAILDAENRVRSWVISRDLGSLAYCLAVSPSGGLAAVALPNSDSTKTLLLMASLLPGKPDGLGMGCVVEKLGTVDEVNSMAFESEDSLLVATIDSQRCSIDLGGGVGYRVGAIQLEPAQLRMMGLDVQIAEADQIHRFDLRTKTSTAIGSGHAVVSAPAFRRR